MTMLETPVPVSDLVYSPEPAVWHPMALLRRMASESWKFRELVIHLVIRDLRAQYRQSLLGYLWAFIPTIVTAVAFNLARDSGVLRIPNTRVDYVVFVMVGTVLWQTFTDALNGPIQAITNFKSVLNRIYLPPEVIIFAKIGEVFVNLSINLIMLAIVFAVYRVPIGPIALLAPLFFLLFILEATAIGLVLAPLSVLYHDVLKGLPIMLTFWFVLTPVVYAPPSEGGLAVVVKLNPATHFLVAIRDVATGGPLPHFWTLAIAGAVSLVAFTIALIGFRVAMPFVIERGSA
jgi:lipopolysaccharide transport system permease protein